MRVVRYATGDGHRIGVLDDDHVVALPEPLASGRAEEVPRDLPIPAGPRIAVNELQLLAPVVPWKIVAVGMNYRDHAEEQSQPIPERPLLFAKFPSAACGPFADIEKPAETKQLDYEAELGVVVGRRARHVAAADAFGFIAGYVALDDVSARDAQFTDGQWVRGKSFDTFAPMGPALVTADEIPDPHDLEVRAWVNGELRQRSNTRNLIFGVDALIEYCSRYFTLEPGDVIATGTPAGVGAFMDPPRFLAVGDVVEVVVESVGRLENRVVAGVPGVGTTP